MPASALPRAFTGGKFTGIRKIVERSPCSPSISQKVVPLRSIRTPPPVVGKDHDRILIGRPPGYASAIEEYGTIFSLFTWMKSKIPCPPGSSPVIKVDHATGLCGGIVD